MTLSIDGTDIGTAIQVASIVGTILALLIGALVLYLLVRPPRKSRDRRPDAEALDAEEVMQVLDRMEQRLAVLERALPREERAPRQLMNAGEEGPDNRRTK